jgi:hypothetical protein
MENKDKILSFDNFEVRQKKDNNGNKYMDYTFIVENKHLLSPCNIQAKVVYNENTKEYTTYINGYILHVIKAQQKYSSNTLKYKLYFTYHDFVQTHNNKMSKDILMQDILHECVKVKENNVIDIQHYKNEYVTQNNLVIDNVENHDGYKVITYKKAQ